MWVSSEEAVKPRSLQTRVPHSTLINSADIPALWEAGGNHFVCPHCPPNHLLKIVNKTNYGRTASNLQTRAEAGRKVGPLHSTQLSVVGLMEAGLWWEGQQGAQDSVLETIPVLDMPEVSFCRCTHTSPCHGLHLWSLGINGSNMLHIDKKIRSDIAQGICIVYSENAHFKNPIRLILPLGYRQWFPLKTEVCVVEGNP